MRQNSFARLSILAGCLALISGVLYLAWTLRSSLNTDEIEHLHCAYLVSEGALPYAGFWEHHSPLLWVLLSPVLKICPPSALIVFYARLFCFAMSGLLFGVVWGIAKLLWKEKADLPLTLFFFLSAGIASQFSILRPDLFMLIFSFASVYWALRGFAARRAFTFFLAGASFGLGVSFSIKVLPWIAVMPMATLVMDREKGWNPFAMNLPYFGGVLAGLLPLGFYLTANGLTDEFFLWVVKFNFLRYPNFQPLQLIAAPLLFTAGFMALLFLKRKLKSEGTFFFACLALVVVFTSVFLFPAARSHIHRYYLASLFIVLTVLGSAVRIYWPERAGIFSKACAGVLLFLALVLPNAKLVVDHEKRFVPLSEQVKLVDWLARHFRDEPVVIFYPWHPIFAKDVSFLYSPIQFDFLNRNRMDFRARAAREARWAEDVIAREPAVLAKWDLDKIVPALRKYGLLTEEEYRRFLGFLRENYSLTTRFGAPLFIRKGHAALDFNA